MPTVTSENAQEFYASRLPPREDAPADDPTPEPGSTETKPAGESQESKEARVKKVAPRIAELVGERNAARTEAETKTAEAQAAAQEAQELRDRLAEAERQLAILNAPQQQNANPRPERKNFATDDQFTDALTDWKVDQRIAADKVREAQARQAAAQAEIATSWAKQIEAAKVDVPDLEEVIGTADTVFPQIVLDAIVDAGPLVAYHLAKNPVEARRIAAMRTSTGIAAILKLSEQLTGDGGKSAAPTAPAPSPAAKGESFRAPEPIDHLKGGSPVVGKDESEMTHEEWVAARRAGRIR